MDLYTKQWQIQLVVDFSAWKTDSVKTGQTMTSRELQRFVSDSIWRHESAKQLNVQFADPALSLWHLRPSYMQLHPPRAHWPGSHQSCWRRASGFHTFPAHSSCCWSPPLGERRQKEQIHGLGWKKTIPPNRGAEACGGRVREVRDFGNRVFLAHLCKSDFWLWLELNWQEKLSQLLMTSHFQQLLYTTAAQGGLFCSVQLQNNLLCFLLSAL